jgi:oxalate decarboxylase/phosphoglucose isomerase-like protein (cupin superfamily)
MKIRISELQNRGDARGGSFSPPADALAFLGRLADMYVASTLPGEVRGNHFHLHKRQVIVVLPGTAWSLHFDQGEGTPVEHRSFDGGAAVLVLVSAGASQAVRNDGDRALWMVVGSSEAYDPASIVARKVI